MRGQVGPASPAGAMLRLLRLACYRLCRVENSRNPAGAARYAYSPVFFIVLLLPRAQALLGRLTVFDEIQRIYGSALASVTPYCLTRIYLSSFQCLLLGAVETLKSLGEYMPR